MVASHRLASAAQLAQRREDEAARVLAEAQRSLERQREELGRLRAYRQEYGARMVAEGERGLPGVQLRRYHGFLEQLDTVIGALESRLAELQNQHERRHHEWLAARARTEALDQVIARDEVASERRRERCDQHAADDLAQRPSELGWRR
jgi:flagellar FliJ protein